MTNEEYKTHRCEQSLSKHASVRKKLTGHTYEQSQIGKWFIGTSEWDGEWGTTYLHTLRCSIDYCPFCGRKLDND